VTSAAPVEDWGHARWRLRDLRGRDRQYAVAMLVAVLVPFAVALVRASRDGWVPSGDEANIATRALDVFSRHPPLTGLPSTSGLYGDLIATNHPGPIEFYLLALPLRVLGMTAGPLLTAAAINGSFVLVSLWTFFRRLGLNAMLWAGVLLLAVMWSAGTSVLTDTLSSNMTMYSLLCFAVLAWALVDGDLALLPLAAFVGSYAAQQHLAAGLIVLPLAAAGSIALAVAIGVRVRRGDPTITRSALRWTGAAAAIAAVCWAPVLYDEVTGHPGNLTEIVRFSRDNTRPTLGLHSGIEQALHAVTPPNMLTRTDTTGAFFVRGFTPIGLAAGIALVGLLVAIVWGARRRSRAVARLALVALVLLVAGVVDGSNVPAGVESTRVNLYRWSWTATFLAWTALGIGAALLADWIAERVGGLGSVARRARASAPVALLVVGALVATSTVVVGGEDDHNRERAGFALEKSVGAKVLSRIDRRHPVVVVSDGYAANLSVAPYVIFRLIDAGVHVEVPEVRTMALGSARQYRPGSGVAAILVVSENQNLPNAPGELIAIQRFSPERSALLDDLSAAARGTNVELAPGRAAFIKREYTGLRGLVLKTLLEKLPTDPRTVLKTPEFVQLLLDGLLRSPALDRAKLRRLLALPDDGNTIGNDEQVEVRLVSAAELAATPLRGLP
jgi:hypothetical protein